MSIIVPERKTKTALNKMVLHAYNETAYYRELFDESGIDANKIITLGDLSLIPLLTKDELQKDEGRFLAEQYWNFPYNEKLLLKRAVCSTGHLMKAYWNSDDDILSKELVDKLRSKWHGIEPTAKMCSFHGTLYRGNMLIPNEDRIVSEQGKHLSFSVVNLTDERIENCFADMADFGVVWLTLSPSVAIILAEAVKRCQIQIPPKLRYIELTDEFVNEEHRRDIKDAFQLEPVYLYRAGETNPIAFECRYKSLHVLEDLVVVETIKDGSPVFAERGNIHVTSLTNKAMPLIRYEIGDIGRLTNIPCRCGEETSMLDLSSGYPCQFYLSDSLQKISGTVMISIIEQTNEHMSRPISKFRITQVQPGEFDVELTLKPAYENWQESIKTEFLANILDSALLQARWNFSFNISNSHMNIISR